MLLTMFSLLLDLVLCNTGCENCLVTRVPEFDNLQILYDALFSRTSPSQGVCFSLCMSDANCVSFTFSEDLRTCRGYNRHFTSPDGVSTSSEAGTRLYSTCKVPPTTTTTTTMTTTTTTTTTTTPCVTYNEYIGCYQNEDGSRIYSGDAYEENEGMTHEIGFRRCRSRGNKYAGFEASTHNICGNTLDVSKNPKVAEGECNHGCRGNRLQTCGGPYRISLYIVHYCP